MPITDLKSSTIAEHFETSILILVLTSERPASLQRLLTSLANAEVTAKTVIDLQINVDLPRNQARQTHHDCVRIARQFEWNRGRKTVFRRMAHAGLSQSWFEAPLSSSHKYISILEDDMELSPHFFSFFELLHVAKSLETEEITAVCLHPNDWEVRVDGGCGKAGQSQYLYLSPEPCNWGPIWKYEEWAKYVDWVLALKAENNLPYVPESIAYNYNKYLDDGKDVQSSWVWRYNLDFNKRQVRYSFTKCSNSFFHTDDKYFAINHKEPGEHFKNKLELQNDPSLLYFDITPVFQGLLSDEESLVPATFTGYKEFEKSMRG